MQIPQLCYCSCEFAKKEKNVRKWQNMMNGHLSHGIVQTVALLLSDIEMHKVLSKFNATDAVL